MMPSLLPRKGSAFRPEDYKEAAEEHIVWLETLFEGGSYVLCIYVSGLAVESLFRGFYARLSNQFDARHDLNEWAKRSGFKNKVPAQMYEQYSTSLTSLMAYWRNDHRYRSETAMRAYFKRLGYNCMIRGDLLKEIARRSRIAAGELVSFGRVIWN
jgi:hypothetical protein